MINLEGFKEIPGYEGRFLAHPDGRIFNTKTKNVLQGSLGKDGYRRIKLSVEGRVETWLVHRLIAATFIPNPDELPFVNHKDEDKDNNCADNLEWCTCKYNNNYGTAKERGAKNRRKPVYCIETDTYYPGLTEAAEALGLCASSISIICNGKGNQTLGYSFRFATDEEKETMNNE